MWRVVRALWLDESGGFIEYLVGLMVIGLGTVAIAAGILQALRPAVNNTQAKVTNLTGSGF